MEILRIKEHSFFDDVTIKQKLAPLKLEFSSDENEIKFLNINSNFQASYFIGVSWLKDRHLALVVEPKIEKLDYLKMFMECFNIEEISKELSKIYKIYFGREPITIDSSGFELTPLLIIDYLNTIKRIVTCGLKKDYKQIEENLQSKIKGKIIINKSFKFNNFKGRTDRNYCNYQEYTIDCFENRILKKALIYVDIYIRKHFKDYKQLKNALDLCLSAFSKVGEEVNITKMRQFKINPLFKEYTHALKIAKMIFEKFGYSINEVNKSKVKEDKFPPFYIDMSLLFECYVYAKLRKEYGKVIKFQVQGHYGKVDFLKIDENMIIDTKYKSYYKEKFSELSPKRREIIITDIRQLSGYSRDKKILNKLNPLIHDENIHCLIIYPNFEKQEDFSKRDLKENEIDGFVNFFKCGIKLPIQS